MMPHPQNTEDPDQQIDSTIIKLAENYASCDRRSAEINDERKTIRDNAEKLGIPSKAFQHAVGMVKHMSEGERRDYTVGMNRVVRAIEGQQATLFPAEAERIRKREDNKKPKGNEGAPDPDKNPRSDPNKGGAKPKTLKEAAAASEAAVAESLANVSGGKRPQLKVVGADAGEMKQPEGITPPNPPDEQAEGEAALNAGLTETKKSQSQIAQEKLEAANLGGKLPN